MRFISKTPQYRVTAIKPMERSVVGQDGRVHRHTEDAGFICQFTPHGLTAWELDEARSKWGKDYADKIPRGGRIENKFGVWDSVFLQDSWIGPDGEKMSDERREEIEQALLRRDGFNNRFLQIDKPRTAAPWPSYDELDDAEKILEVMNTIAMHPEVVLIYERENQNRQAVLDAIEARYDSGTPTEREVKVPA